MAFNSCVLQKTLYGNLCGRARAKVWTKLLNGFNITGPVSTVRSTVKPSFINRETQEETAADVLNLESLVAKISFQMDKINSTASFDNSPNESPPYISISKISVADIDNMLITISDLKAKHDYHSKR